MKFEQGWPSRYIEQATDHSICIWKPVKAIDFTLFRNFTLNIGPAQRPR